MKCKSISIVLSPNFIDLYHNEYQDFISHYAKLRSTLIKNSEKDDNKTEYIVQKNESEIRSSDKISSNKDSINSLPKCPNCNNEVLNDEDEHNLNQGKDTKIIKIKKKTEIKDPNMNIPNLNIRGVININNNIDDASNSNYDASQSNRPELDEF